MYNLEYLQGTRVLDQAIMALARPVLDLIATQSVVIQKCGVSVRLEAHWIPGHEHKIDLPSKRGDGAAPAQPFFGASGTAKRKDRWCAI
ncbi:28fdacaa-1bdd-4d01-baa3-142ac4cfdf1f [Thermothielavioides terrestris]|uniref:28fdacaa-1bdd-4d01-baa3-142ac4cfdf1f n=1 Tax=Thermothielavioides terrestris TaxID=2587410 RepID=A0A3S4ATF6_9PEZI|nr:28fdacaa-1bdd-4d01-baa3-142ac4cfdf1f [Thermothielavioides terrestris]